MTRLMPPASHFLVENDVKKYCKLCYDTYSNCRAKVRTHCNKCGFGFHIDCFKSWHSNPTPKSLHKMKSEPELKKQKKG